MRIPARRLTLLLVTLVAATATLANAQSAPRDSAAIVAFNRQLDAATKQMDNAATLALWEDDGVSLLPGAKPLVGKPAIRQMIEQVTAANPGAHMESFELECFDIHVAGDWASEWCTEHQVVALGGGKRFDGRGRMLFVLHRAADGQWRLHDEMWNEAPRP